MPKVMIKEQSKEVSPLERFRKVFTEIPAPKGGLPTMPTKVSGLASEELGDTIAKYTAWREYTEDRHAEACAVLSEVKSKYDLASDIAMQKISANSVTEKKALVRADDSVSILHKELTESEIFVNLLGRKLDSFSNVLTMLSRELTRRGVNQ